jgi:hypothetical protein
MKRIVTEGYHNPIVLNLSEIKDLIKELPYSEHRFVVFSEDGDTGDYVQTILENEELDEESRYQVEARVYHSPDSFTHYRTFVETADEAFAPFEAFYNNTPYSYDRWENVTEEFAN